MSAAFGNGKEISSRSWVGAQAGLVAAGQQAKELFAVDEAGPDGAVVLAVTGHIAQDEVYRQRLGAVPGGAEQGKTQGLACSLLAIYQQFGPAGLQSLNGIYTVAVWEERPGRLTVIGDRYGMQPFYTWQSGQELLFASRLQAISSYAKFPRQINPVAVFDLLAAEQMLDERTLFSGIQALPPAGLLTFENGRCEVHSYWQPALYSAGGEEPTEAEAIEGLAERVFSAVNLMLGSAVSAAQNGDPRAARAGACLMLTGGLDSRLLAGSLTRFHDGFPIRATTIGHERARDVRYGREIAQAAGLPYTMLPARPDYLAEYAAEFIRRTEGGSNAHAAWIMGEVGYLEEEHIQAVFTGVGAEAISGRHWLSDQAVTTREGALDRLCAERWTYARAAALMRPEIREETMQASRESLHRTLDEAPVDNLMGWSDYLAYRQLRRHPTGTPLSENALVLEPFYENRLVDYAFALPPALRNNGMLYKKTIVQHFPELSKIGYTDSGVFLEDELYGNSTRRMLEAKARDLSRRARNRLGRRLPMFRSDPFGDRPAHAFYYNHWLRTAARPFVLDVISREDLYADFLDVDAVRKMVKEHMAGLEDDFRLVSAVVTFALWREQYDKG